MPGTCRVRPRGPAATRATVLRVEGSYLNPGFKPRNTGVQVEPARPPLAVGDKPTLWDADSPEHHPARDLQPRQAQRAGPDDPQPSDRETENQKASSP